LPLAAHFHRPVAQSVNKSQDLGHGFVDFRRNFLFKIEARKNAPAISESDGRFDVGQPLAGYS
jgi:hypothetical protein